MDNRTQISRQELYDKVWTTPISRIAKEYGLSDVGLSNICRRHHIPKPARGYWARIAHGQAVKKEPLPELRPDETEVNEFTIEANAETTNFANRYEDTRAELARIEQKAAAFSGIQTGQLRHPLVLALQKIRRQLHPETEGWLSPGRRSFLDVRATPGSWDRALKLMHMVLLAAEQLGYRIRIDAEKGTILTVLGEDISIGLKEKVTRSEVQQQEGPVPRFSFLREKYKYAPTGLLVLSVKGFYLHKARANWSDTARAQIEEHLGDFFSGLVEVVARLRDRESKWKERERQRQETERIEQERRRKAQEERDRVQQLMHDAENWQKASILRRYVAARTKAQQFNNAEATSLKEFLEWSKWAIGIADSLDPLLRPAEKLQQSHHQ